jgi:hypothetical protein
VAFRERFDAVQWFPDKPHPAVKMSVLESGMARNLYPEIAHQLDTGEGQIGVMYVHDALGDWMLVHPGDWLVSRRGGKLELVKETDFSRRFSEE